MADKPQDVRVKLVHQLLERSYRGALAEVSSIHVEDADLKHLLGFLVILQWRNRGAAEERSEAAAVAQHSGSAH